MSSEAKEEGILRLMKAAEAAHQDAKSRGLGKGKGGAGEIKCPACERGRLRYVVNERRGHMRGVCTTPDCVNWVE